MAAQGIEIDHSTLAGWVGQASLLLDPIVSRIRAVGLTASKTITDDRPVPILDPGRGETAIGRLRRHEPVAGLVGRSPPITPARIPSANWPASPAISRQMAILAVPPWVRAFTCPSQPEKPLRRAARPARD